MKSIKDIIWGNATNPVDTEEYVSQSPEDPKSTNLTYYFTKSMLSNLRDLQVGTSPVKMDLDSKKDPRIPKWVLAKIVKKFGES
jgi:hypothetical protein